MTKPLHQITFEFTGPEEQREFLSGKPLPPGEKKKRGRKSTKDVVEDEPEVPEDAVLYQKQYYSISEAAAMLKLNASVLRFWDGEFEMELRKNKKGDRFYKPDDIKNLLLIYDLLRRRKFTVEGAKEFLKKNKQANEKYAAIQSLQRLRQFLLEIKAHL